MQVLTLSMEKIVRSDRQHDVQVATLPIAAAHITFAAISNTCSFFYTRWNLDRKLDLFSDACLAPASITGISYDRSSSSACIACPRHGEEPLLITDLSASMALRTGGRTAPRLAPCSLARLTRLETPNAYFLFRPENGFLEIDSQVITQIVPAHLPRRSLLPAHVEHFAKQIAEDVPQVYRPRESAKTAGASAAHARMAKPVVCRSLVRIAQHLVGLACFLELLFGCVITRISIGMVLQRKFSICALKLLLARTPRYSKHLVVVSFAHSRIQTFLYLLNLQMAPCTNRLSPNSKGSYLRTLTPSFARLFRVRYYPHQSGTQQFLPQLVSLPNLFRHVLIGKVVALD